MHRFIGKVAWDADVVMPRAESTAMDNSCQALCRNLVTQNGLQPENVDISQSVLYTSIMGLLLVTDNEVRQCCAIDTFCLKPYAVLVCLKHSAHNVGYPVMLETTGLAYLQSILIINIKKSMK